MDKSGRCFITEALSAIFMPKIEYRTSLLSNEERFFISDELCQGGFSMPNPTRISLPRVNYNFDAKATIAYLLAPGINDRASDVRQLGKWFRGKNVLINLLQYNETACKRIKRPNKQQLVAFKIRLEEAGLEVKLRESRGNRIKAACGQLVSDYNKGNDAPTSDSPEKMSPVIHKLSDNKADTTRGIRKEKRHPFAKHKAKRKRKKN